VVITVRAGVCLGAFTDLKPHDWCLTDDYLHYIEQDELKWVPDADYYVRLISRLVDSILIDISSSFSWPVSTS